MIDFVKEHLRVPIKITNCEYLEFNDGSLRTNESSQIMVLENEDFISKDVTNSCKLLINNTRFFSNGFILRINLNSTIGPDSFSMNLTNNSNFNSNNPYSNLND